MDIVRFIILVEFYYCQNVESDNQQVVYSEVPNRRADRNKLAELEKSAKLLAYLLSKLINEQGGIFHLLHKKLRASRVERKSEKSKRACMLFH